MGGDKVKKKTKRKKERKTRKKAIQNEGRGRCERMSWNNHDGCCYCCHRHLQRSAILCGFKRKLLIKPKFAIQMGFKHVKQNRQSIYICILNTAICESITCSCSMYACKCEHVSVVCFLSFSLSDTLFILHPSLLFVCFNFGTCYSTLLDIACIFTILLNLQSLIPRVIIQSVLIFFSYPFAVCRILHFFIICHSFMCVFAHLFLASDGCGDTRNIVYI